MTRPVRGQAARPREVLAEPRYVPRECAPHPVGVEVVVLMCGEVSHVDDLPPRLAIEALANGRGDLGDGLADPNQSPLDSPLRLHVIEKALLTLRDDLRDHFSYRDDPCRGIPSLVKVGGHSSTAPRSTRSRNSPRRVSNAATSTSTWRRSARARRRPISSRRLSWVNLRAKRGHAASMRYPPPSAGEVSTVAASPLDYC